ncbi:hypothetical protein [Flammeovirga kamogawensis]|uniref:Uncharacterized protein n=1 Tax=Flammeovirga kamogawensis TaxID=373891 RepID=A0ABX8H4P9_9BACT|nr:hypothetical protein [Flammeovirga kamogawensis]MBB6461757.1 hypothetical protein [Flammeovirga kamogawensis]QWG10673.1 hypothetical protein KM029_25150 [Flammeovirga kamogawensis]TRX63776.1 hypothetical protein EO216_25525 [Flammeovirga kamogawensis]
MPANLNALIRYRTINNCLHSNNLGCSLGLLIERCSDALSDAKGKIISISKRSIQEDIRILRSDILGFNAPIIFEEGKYFYDPSSYSIYELPISHKNTIMGLINLLIEEKDNIKSQRVDVLLKQLKEMVQFEKEEEMQVQINSSQSIQMPLENEIDMLEKIEERPIEVNRKSKKVRAMSFPSITEKSSISWGDFLSEL